MNKGNGTRGILAMLAMVACCTLPLLVVTAGGAIAALGGVAVSYWPITVLGVILAVWAGVRLGRLVRARNRALRVRDNSDR